LKDESNNLAISENLAIMRQFRGKALWAALATLFDGEGCITILRNERKGTDLLVQFTVRLDVANTNGDWLKAWKLRVEKGNLFLYEQTERKWKDRYNWVINKKADVVYILKRILPYLIVKREQAQIALDLIENKIIVPFGTRAWERPGELELTRRENLYNRMRYLNKKGRRESVETIRQVSQVESDIVRSSEQPEAPYDNAMVE
jgi:hypothetical protein